MDKIKHSEPTLNMQGIKNVIVTHKHKADSRIEFVGDFHAVERVKSFALDLLKQEQTRKEQEK